MSGQETRVGNKPNSRPEKRAGMIDPIDKHYIDGVEEAYREMSFEEFLAFVHRDMGLPYQEHGVLCHILYAVMHCEYVRGLQDARKIAMEAIENAE